MVDMNDRAKFNQLKEVVIWKERKKSKPRKIDVEEEVN